MIEDYDEDVKSPMSNQAYMVKEVTDQQAKTKKQQSKDKAKKAALAQGRSKTNMSSNDKERVPKSHVKKNNLKSDKDEESKKSKDYNTKKIVKKPTRKSNEDDYSSDKQPQAKEDSQKLLNMLPQVNENEGLEGVEMKAVVLPKKKSKN